MEEGSLRIDANVSVRPPGHRGVRHPLRDQEPELAAVVDQGGRVRGASGRSPLASSATRSCRRPATGTKTRGRTISGRSKEEAHDYRYFPEPDLVPVAPTDEMRADVRATMPELPAARRTRLIAEWGIKEDDARVLVNVPGLADYTATAIAALKAGTPKDVVNWVRQDVLAYLNDTSGLSPALLDARDARRARRSRHRRHDLPAAGEGRARRVTARRRSGRATSSKRAASRK